MPSRFLLLLVLLRGCSLHAEGLWNWVSNDFEVLMRTHGQVTFAPYVHGGSARNGFQPGYRSDFNVDVDFFAWKGLISNWRIANSTIIERPESTTFRVDRIRYTLTPGYRKEFDKWQINGMLLHECIHSVSRQESTGSMWWNSFRFGFGSKGAYQQFLVERYTSPIAWNLWNLWDYQFNLGTFLYGKPSAWLAQNHIYRYEESAMLRVHLRRWGRWGAYADLAQNFWVNSRWELEQKWSATANLMLRGKMNLASVYYTYHFYDDNTHDNEDGLGAMGFKIVF